MPAAEFALEPEVLPAVACPSTATELPLALIGTFTGTDTRPVRCEPDAEPDEPVPADPVEVAAEAEPAPVPAHEAWPAPTLLPHTSAGMFTGMLIPDPDDAL